jgi:hypothetical protein
MTFEEAETFRWNPFDLTKVNHLWAFEPLVLLCSRNTCSISSSAFCEVAGSCTC